MKALSLFTGIGGRKTAEVAVARAKRHLTIGAVRGGRDSAERIFFMKWTPKNALKGAAGMTETNECKKLFEWEDDVPPTCRTCMNAKHVIRLAAEAYRLRREVEEIRLLAREAMRRRGGQLTMTIEDWLKGV